MTVTGWSLEYINDLEMNDVFALSEYWNDNPPLHLQFNAYVWAKSGKRPPRKSKNRQAPLTPTEQRLSNIPAMTESQLPAYALDWLKSVGKEPVK